MYRPACYTFHPVSSGMVLIWEGFYQRELLMPVWPDEVLPVPFQKPSPHDIPTCTLERTDVADHLFCIFDLFAASFQL